MITVNQRVQVIAVVVEQAEAVVVEEEAVAVGDRIVEKGIGVLKKTTNIECRADPRSPYTVKKNQ